MKDNVRGEPLAKRDQAINPDYLRIPPAKARSVHEDFPDNFRRGTDLCGRSQLLHPTDDTAAAAAALRTTTARSRWVCSYVKPQA
jgi:hypothetical protein